MCVYNVVLHNKAVDAPPPFMLLQVHEAYTHDGQHVAVKVQHEGLRESSVADIATIEALVSIVKWVFPTFDYMWLVEETKLNLPKVCFCFCFCFFFPSR